MHSRPVWHDIETAPLHSDIALAVIEDSGVHVLAFACQRSEEGWIDTSTGNHVDVHPTHWSPWATDIQDT